MLTKRKFSNIISMKIGAMNGQHESKSSRADTRENQLRQQGEIAINVLKEEALNLHNLDHPGMMLVSTPLTGNNFLLWSRSIKTALGAKTKLYFIDGTLVQPTSYSPQYALWKKADCMVLSWLLNSISKDIFESFIYANSSRNLCYKWRLDSKRATH